jgi:hypothetical protein
MSGETDEYKAPEHVIKPYPGDTGFPLVKGSMTQSEWSLKKKKKKMKTYSEFKKEKIANEALINEAQQFFFNEEIKSDRVEIQNAPGAENQTATVKWSLELNSNAAGVEAFVVTVKELRLKWGADDDLGKPGEATVDTSKIETTVKGSLNNLYVEQISYDNKVGTAEVRFGRDSE